MKSSLLATTKAKTELYNFSTNTKFQQKHKGTLACSKSIIVIIISQ